MCMIRSMKLGVAMLLAAVFGGFGDAAVIAGDYTFRVLVEGGGGFDGFNAPALNNNGEIVFFAFRDDGSAGIFSANGTTVTTVVDDTGDFSFFGGGMSLASYPVINDNGTVAFFAYRDNYEHGVYKWSGGTITTIAESGTPPFTCAFSNPAMNASGEIALQACLEGIGGAIVRGTVGPPLTLIDESGVLAILGDQVGINSAGTVSFWATLDAGGEGMFTTDGGGVATTLVDSSGAFEWFSGASDINAGGDVAFWAQLDDGTDGVYVANAAGVAPIVETTGPFAGFSIANVGINDAGVVAFAGTLESWDHGVFTGHDPNTNAVIVSGDTLLGSVVTSIEFMQFGLNEHSQVAFSYSLDDGRFGLALATPVGAALLGDVDGDCDVDLTDLAILLSDFDCTSACVGDVDGDDDTDLTDLAQLLAHFDETCG